MKRFFVLLAALLIVGTFTACGTDKPAANDKVKVVATIFPAYDWAREIIGGSRTS